jgi:hypothetical protein
MNLLTDNNYAKRPSSCNAFELTLFKSFTVTRRRVIQASRARYYRHRQTLELNAE